MSDDLPSRDKTIRLARNHRKSYCIGVNLPTERLPTMAILRCFGGAGIVFAFFCVVLLGLVWACGALSQRSKRSSGQRL